MGITYKILPSIQKSACTSDIFSAPFGNGRLVLPQEKQKQKTNIFSAGVHTSTSGLFVLAFTQVRSGNEPSGQPERIGFFQEKAQHRQTADCDQAAAQKKSKKQKKKKALQYYNLTPLPVKCSSTLEFHLTRPLGLNCVA